jgi:hypothetical protein
VTVKFTLHVLLYFGGYFNVLCVHNYKIVVFSPFSVFQQAPVQIQQHHHQVKDPKLQVVVIDLFLLEVQQILSLGIIR